MCGRYTFTAPAPVVEARFEATMPADAAPTFNAAPSQRLPIITNAEPGKVQLFQWGLLPAWVKDAQKANRPINARAETLTEKPSFRQLLQRRRCLVLADSFYEWERPAAGSKGPKIPHRILLRTEQPFALAGLWDEWVNRETGEVHPTFTIITTEPNELMAGIHDRMPVILPGREAELQWLDDGGAAKTQLLRPYHALDMKQYTVGSQVNSPGNNDSACAAPFTWS
ncbi:SOS response-associated peptidase [Hymenobacter lutimineralis]|uniref:Abasic site processing protein n=1 Tax=Hymenobacter lutimineralis TaxID=2606448 RepID=A0A5D6VAK7_9BACT|nr:SOS response-associated peptidase [Hymenobacter lutimineralis]TYZ11869.1 SOS response-associated peptidase [Hymenobacter lutimineralis]